MREVALAFRKFLNGPVGKKLVASQILNDVDPQYLLENYLQLAFKAGRESIDPPVEQPKASSVNAEEVIRMYNEVFGRDLKPLPQRVETIAGRVREAKVIKMDLQAQHFRQVFEFKKAEAEGKQESWLEFETLCARKHFFKYLDKAKEHSTPAKPTIRANQRLF
jgi:hypothetical protein